MSTPLTQEEVVFFRERISKAQELVDNIIEGPESESNTDPISCSLLDRLQAELLHIKRLLTDGRPNAAPPSSSLPHSSGVADVPSTGSPSSTPSSPITPNTNKMSTGGFLSEIERAFRGMVTPNASQATTNEMSTAPQENTCVDEGDLHTDSSNGQNHNAADVQTPPGALRNEQPSESIEDDPVASLGRSLSRLSFRSAGTRDVPGQSASTDLGGDILDGVRVPSPYWPRSENGFLGQDPSSPASSVRSHVTVVHHPDEQVNNDNTSDKGKGKATIIKDALSRFDQHQREGQPISWYFNCICGVRGDNLDDGSFSLTCERCGTWSHAACNGITPEEVERDEFEVLCNECREKQSSIEMLGAKTLKLADDETFTSLPPSGDAE